MSERRRTRGPRALLAAGIAGLTLAAAGGCATPTEREVARIEDEIETYSARTQENEELLAERYGAAREQVAAARERELLEQRGFRIDLLSRVQASRDRVVLQSLERMRRLVQSPERRKEMQSQLTALESLYTELLETTKRLTGEMVAIRTAARDAQLEALSAELAAKRDALEVQRRQFVERRKRRIASVKGSGSTGGAATAEGPAGAAPPTKEGAGPADVPASGTGSPAASSGEPAVAPADKPAAPADSPTPAAPTDTPSAPPVKGG